MALGEPKEGEKSPSKSWEKQVGDTHQAETLASYWYPGISEWKMKQGLLVSGVIPPHVS